MFGDDFWSVNHRSNRIRFRSKTMPNRGQTTWSFSSFASFSSLTMNVHWRCSSTHISYTVTCTSRPLFCNSFFQASPLPTFCASRQAMWWCEPIRLLPSAQRRRPARGASKPRCRSTPSRPRRSGSPRRHPAACTHLSKSSFSVKSKHRMHPQTQLADMTPLVSLSNLFVVLSLHHKDQSVSSLSLAVTGYTLTSIYWETLAKNHKNLINGAQAS